MTANHLEDVLESAAELLPSGAAGTARALVAKGDHAAALRALAEAADRHPAPPRFWEFLTDAAEQLPGAPDAEWYRWRTTEALRGQLRIDLTLATDDDLAPIPPGRGLQPQWDLGEHAVSSYRAVRVAALWVEGDEPLTSGGRAFARLLPLDDAHWHNLMPGDVIAMRDGDRVVGSATVLDVTWPDPPTEQTPALLPDGFGDLPLPPAPPTRRVRARTGTEHTTWPNLDCPIQVSALIPGLRHRYVRVMRPNGSVSQPYPCATQAEFVRHVAHERPDLDPKDPAETHWDDHPGVWPA